MHYKKMAFCNTIRNTNDYKLFEQIVLVEFRESRNISNVLFGFGFTKQKMIKGETAPQISPLDPHMGSGDTPEAPGTMCIYKIP